MRTAIALLAVAAAASPAAADSWKEVDRARTGSMPWSVSVAPDGRSLFVAHVGYRDHDAVWKYRASDLDRIAKVSFEGHGVETAVTRDGAAVYVTNSRTRELIALAASDLSVKRRYRVGSYAKDLVLSPDGATAYVANYGAGTVSAVDLSSGKRSDIATGKKTRGVALSPDGTILLAMNFGDRTVAVVDTAKRTVVRRIRVCRNPRHAVFTGERALVTCFGDSKVVEIDPATGAIERSIRTGPGPKTIALAADGRTAATADERGDSATIIDVAGWSASRVKLRADQPCGVAFAPDGQRLYLTARGSNRLIVLERQGP